MSTAFLESLSAHPLVTSIGWTLVHFVWQAALVGVVVALVLGMMRRSSAHVRYLFGLLGLAVMTAAPIGTFSYLVSVADRNDWKLLPELVSEEPASVEGGIADAQSRGELEFSQRAIIVPGVASAWPLGNLADTQLSDNEINEPEIAAATGWVAGFKTFSGSMQRWLPWCVVVWIAGVMCLAVRLLIGLRRVWLWRSQGVEIVGGELSAAVSRLSERMNLRQRVRLLETVRDTVPAVIGWIRPAILVPASMVSGLTTSELDSILAHELAHIRRYDYLVNLIQTVVETLLFYHPAVWWLSSRIRAERENCCDDIAIAVCGNRVVFAQALARMEEIRCRGERLSMAASGGSLVGRIRRIVGTEQVCAGPWWPAGAIVLGSLAVLLSGLWMTANASQSTGNPESRSEVESMSVSTEDPPEKSRDALKDARFTTLTSILRKNQGAWYCTLHVESINQRIETYAGDTFELDETTWTVKSISRSKSSVVIEVNGSEHVVRVGETLGDVVGIVKESAPSGLNRTAEKGVDDYEIRKSEVAKIDSKTGIEKRVFSGIQLDAGDAGDQQKATAEMMYSNVMRYTFIPARIAKRLGATELGEIDFGAEPPPVQRAMQTIFIPEMQELTVPAANADEGNRNTLQAHEVMAAVDDDVKVVPYSDDAVWIPGHLGFYGMNQTKQHVFKIVRIEKVDLGVGPAFGPVNALVLDDANSAFGVLGSNWVQQVRGENGEGLWFDFTGTFHFMAPPAQLKEAQPAEAVEAQDDAPAKITVESSGHDETPARLERDGVKVLATHTYPDNFRQSTGWVELNGAQVPIDVGVEHAGVKVYKTLMYDIVAVDSKTEKTIWSIDWGKTMPMWNTVSIVELDRGGETELAVELYTADQKTRELVYKYVSLATGRDVEPPAESTSNQETDSTGDRDQGKQLTFQVIDRDDERITRAAIGAFGHGRSATELVRHFSVIDHDISRFREGVSTTNMESIVSAIGFNYLLDNRMDASEVRFNLPEGSGLRAEFTGENVEIATGHESTTVVVTKGRIEMIDSGGVIRAWASPDGGAEQLVIECREDLGEVAMAMKARRVRPDADYPDPPVQVVMNLETGAPADEKDPPHRGIRYEIQQGEDDGKPFMRMKMKWRYEMKRLMEEAKAETGLTDDELIFGKKAPDNNPETTIRSQPARPSPGTKSSDPTPAVQNSFDVYSVSGTVIDGNGAPVKGAVLVSKIWREASEKPEVVEGTSDDEGKFRLLFPVDLRYSVDAHTFVYKEGFAIRTVMMKKLFKDVAEIHDVEIKLLPSLPTGFRVLLPDGSPCESARVRPRNVQVPNGVFDADEPTGLMAPLPHELSISVGAKTDSDGWATIDSVAKEMLASVVVEASGFGTQEFTKTDGELQLAPAGEIRGKIDARNAGRFEGTSIWIETASMDPRDAPWNGIRKGIVELRVDENGEFHVPEIAAGRLRIRFVWDENAEVQPFIERGTSVHSGEILDLHVETRPTATVSGIVLTSDTRLPVAGARVHLWNTEGCSFGESFETDDSGKYAGQVAPGNLMVQVHLPTGEGWYQKYGFPRLSEIKTPIDVETHELPNILLPLKSVEQDSWDIKEANDENWGDLAQRSGLRSRLTLMTDNPTVGQPMQFKLEIKNFGEEPTTIDLQNYFPYRVLRAVHADGQPAKFVGIAYQTSQENRTLQPGETVVAWDDLDANDLFLLEHGKYRFFAEGGEWATQTLWRDSNTVEVEIAAGEQAPLNRLVMELGKNLPDKWEVSNGMGLAEGWKGVFLTHLPTSLKRDATGIQIWFTDEKLADDFELGNGDQKQIVTQLGKCELGYMNFAAQPKTPEIWPGYLEHVRQAAEKSLTFDINVDPEKLPWSVEGRVTNGEGNPVEGATVRAHCGFGSLRETGSAVTGPEGRYRFSFGPGMWSENDSMIQAATISVSLDGHFEKNLHRQGDLLAAMKLPANGEIGWGGRTAKEVFLPGQPKTVNFVMMPATRMQGVVLGADGDRLDGVRVSLVGKDMPPSSSVVANTRTDKGGRFELTEIPTGFRYQILVEPHEAKPPWRAWASAPMVFAHGTDSDTHIEYSIDDGSPVDFSCQQLYLTLNGPGIPWKTELKEAEARELKLTWDGLSTDKMERAGIAFLDLGEMKE